MTISFSWVGAYLEHKDFFDEMANAMQAKGHRVGIIAGEREKHADNSGRRVIDQRAIVEQSLGFKPDFVVLWGETETIANTNLWKAQKMDEQDSLLHFDDDAKEIKRYTERWVVKTMNNDNKDKF